jgi:hypothetical protein
MKDDSKLDCYLVLVIIPIDIVHMKTSILVEREVVRIGMPKAGDKKSDRRWLD